MVPAIFAMYIGYNKPSSFDEYFADFFADLAKLNGTFEIDGRKFRIRSAIHYTLDIPALGDVCGVKVSGYDACTKCTTVGVTTNKIRGVHYPELGELRTMEGFTNQTYPKHQKRISILQRNGVDMVRDIDIDPMHSSELGIGVLLAKRFGKAAFPGLSERNMPDLEKVMMDARIHQPAEFGRKFQSFSRHTFWKASEHRNFLLFLLPVIAVHLKGKAISLPYYKLLIMLFVGLRLLAYESFAKTAAWVDKAENLLTRFVEGYSRLFGEHKITIKIHQLYHLANQVRLSGLPLYALSAYPFENFMNSIKRTLHSANFPLSQIHRRFVEIYHAQCAALSSRHKLVELSYKFKAGSKTKIDHIIYKGSYVGTAFKDAFFAVGSADKIFKIEQISKSEGGEFSLQGREIESLENLFHTGLNSSEIGVYKSTLLLSPASKTFALKELHHKLFIIPLPLGQEFALIPMETVHGTSLINA